MIFYFKTKNTNGTIRNDSNKDKEQIKSPYKLFKSNYTEGIVGIKSTLFVR